MLVLQLIRPVFRKTTNRSEWIHSLYDDDKTDQLT